MAKNKLAIQNPKALLAEMYILIMGDEADDVEDVRLSYIGCLHLILPTLFFYFVEAQRAAELLSILCYSERFSTRVVRS